MKNKWYVLPAILLIVLLFLQGCAGIGEWFGGGGQTPTNKAPNEPTLIQPQDNTILNTVYVTFKWSCSDPDGDTLTYDLYLAEQSQSLSLYKEGIKETQYVVSLEPGKSYQWKIVAKDPKNLSSSSKVYKFSISPFTRPVNVWDFLYVAGASNGLLIYDVTRPNEIDYPSFFKEQITSTKEIVVFGEWAYMIDYSGNIVCANLANYLSGKDPQTKVISSFGSYPAYARRIKAGTFSGSNYLIVASNDRTFAYNIGTGSSTPYSGLKSVNAIAIGSNNMIYLAGSQNNLPTLVKLKLGTDGALNVEGKTTLNYTPLDMVLKDNYVLLVGSSSNSLYLEAYDDLTPYATSVELGKLSEDFAGITVHEDRVFVAAGNSGIVSFDLDDLVGNLEKTEISTCTEWTNTSYAKDVIIRAYTNGLYAYVSANDGLYIFDVDDQPELINRVDFVTDLYRISAPQQ
ncbi:MAG TPA: hypothetical protein PLP64_03820 [Pseudothermotoga sp.]|nr:hypothetical protein [Pseudothermotoga sp.]HOK83335.1 hypothetical protein [Pseudothermotoga sp.]HPP70160.1 hypothetical protein [Pseudothermotoga sp.]